MTYLLSNRCSKRWGFDLTITLIDIKEFREYYKFILQESLKKNLFFCLCIPYTFFYFLFENGNMLLLIWNNIKMLNCGCCTKQAKRLTLFPNLSYLCGTRRLLSSWWEVSELDTRLQKVEAKFRRKFVLKHYFKDSTYRMKLLSFYNI